MKRKKNCIDISLDNNPEISDFDYILAQKSEDKGWDEDQLVIVLLNFISQKCSYQEFSKYLDSIKNVEIEC